MDPARPDDREGEIMKTSRICLVGIFSAGLLLAGCSSQNSDWQHAQQKNTIAAYQQFIKKYPDSKHVADAKQQIAHINQQREIQQARADWQRTRKLDSAPAYRQFLQNHPNSQYADQAHQRINDIQRMNQWAYARSSNNVQALQEFISQYPNSPQAAQAHQELEKLQAAQAKQQQQVAAAKKAQEQKQKAAATQAQGNYQVQLGAFTRQSTANKAEQQLQARVGGQLNGASIKVYAPQSGSSLYRVKTTPMSQQDAASLCQSLQKNGTDCFVVKRAETKGRAISR